MRLKTVRIFVGAGFGSFALATAVGWLIASRTHAVLTNNSAFDIRHPLSLGNPLTIGAWLGLGLAALCCTVAFVGAIVRLGQLRQWGWLAALLTLIVFLRPAGIVAFALYLIIGPDAQAGPDPRQHPSTPSA